MALNRRRYHLYAGFAVNTQCPLRSQRNDNTLRFTTVHNFLRGLTDVIRLCEFAVNQRAEFFEVGFDQFDIAER
ncbi:hypothetical protein D3C81_1978990 [compost metagenome]